MPQSRFFHEPAKSGTIINVSSIAGFAPDNSVGVYGASKTFINGFSEMLAVELSNHGVVVQALCPGLTHTEFHEDPQYQKFKARTPKIMWMTSEEVVEESLNALKRGSGVYIPGLKNRFMTYFLKRGWVKRMVRGFAKRVRGFHTRFPPEPNGYLHIGHAKAISIDFGIAQEFGGKCNLRFDDTNPVKEDVEYVDAIMEDIRWLGFDWEDRLFYASDYFEQLYQYALQLIRKGKAYVDDLSPDEIRQHRGTLTEPGRESPYRNRSIDENLDLFQRMRAGEFPDGARVLRAKIDMASGNMNMRDPVLYRILHSEHHRTGDAWCIYPMYDFAHGQSDSMEGITHSLCSLEYEAHRPLYDWFLDELEIYHPRQIEFARLNLSYTVMSKRKLLKLVQEKHVSGWTDPRMPTLSGMRRRGYTARGYPRLFEPGGRG
jgi:hypothetical protein